MHVFLVALKPKVLISHVAQDYLQDYCRQKLFRIAPMVVHRSLITGEGTKKFRVNMAGIIAN